MQYREIIGDMPSQIRALPVSEHGYPVPYFVARIEGKYDFRVIDPLKMRACIANKRCWICGQTLGRYKSFSSGPLIVVTKHSAEPPSHRDCAEFAARTCPFMVHPRAQYRSPDIPDTTVNTMMIAENPGVTVIWTTAGYEIQRHHDDLVFIPQEASAVQWFTEGRPATREEAEDGLAHSLNNAITANKDFPDTIRHLMENANHVEGYLPLA